MALGFHKGLMSIEGHKAQDNSYLVAEACRNSFALMLSVLYGWLPKVLAFGANKKGAMTTMVTIGVFGAWMRRGLTSS